MDFSSLFKAYTNHHYSDQCYLCFSLFTVTDQPNGVDLTQPQGKSAQNTRDNRERQESREQEHDKQIRDLQQQLQVSDGRIQEIQQHKQELERATREKDLVIEAREKQIHELQQQMVAKERVATQFQQNLMTVIQKLQEDIRDLRHELREKDKILQRLMVPQNKKLTLSWKRCHAAPCKMCRGSSTVCGSMAYFSSFASGQVHSYNSDTDKWSTLPECPRTDFTLTVINGLVTAVGGSQYLDYTNALLSLMEENGVRKWVEHFPHMATKRALAAVLCNGKALVVAGGEGEDFTVLSTVEVMNTDTLQWSTASSLPRPLSAAVATVCRDSIYLVAGRHQRRTAESVLTCSLSDLQSYSSYQIWRPIADLPVEHSTLITLNGQLLAVGGQDYQNKTNNIYSYNRETNSWEVISHMTTPRYQCLVAVLPHNELMVVGGWTTTGDTDKIEIASVEISSKYVVSQHIICYSEL